MNLVQFGETPPGDRYESVLEPPSGPLPSIQRIKDAILTLQTDPRSVTLDTLNNIMMLRYLPEQFALLSAPIIPSCISILEQSGKHGEIIDSDAGVLALQILCFAVGVAVLVRNKYLGDFLKTLNVARARAFVSDCMEQIIKRGTQDMNHGLAAPHGLFGWDTDNAPPMACLTELGGFDKYHARFLLEHLWIHRNSTMKLFRDVFLPGWSLVVHLIWKHAEFLDEPGAETMFEQLRELVIRFSLVCTSSEDFVLHRHYLELNSVVDYPTKAGPMDRDDLVVVVACCVVKLNPPYEWLGVHNPIALDFATDLVEAIFYDIRHTQDSIELSLPLLKAGFTRLWMDLSKAPQEDVKWIDVVPFTYQLLRLTGVNFAFANDYNFRRRVTAYPVLSVILEADLIDILGRLCLMPVLLSIIPPGVETGWYEVTKCNHSI
ncbi:hypothetical protein FRC09_010054 [Ceratobasidium sp. 395]|nr:hypothetical protein FRC09_010054 [Ceratobasidium sp. 395]